MPWAERDTTVLWVSHILISHSQAEPDSVLRPLGWAPDQRAQRSVAEAASLARRVGAEAKAHPEQFEALARQYSDDAVTRDTGGRLGGIRASQLPETFVDALTMLRPGEVSEVVTTTQGFHVLLSRAAPPKETVAGRRIVIRYDGIPDYDGRPSTRSREEARRLADQLVARVRAGAAFSDLVAEYSEHADRILHGELGSWSTIAPAHNARELETLGNLDVGDVADPMDSVFGYQVLQRIEPSSVRRYAMAAIRIKYAPGVSADDPMAKGKAESKARELSRLFHASPGEFSRGHAEDGSPQVETWDFGHGEPELTERIEKLAFNEVAAEPVELPLCFVVPMRLDPVLVGRPEAPVRYDLPLRGTPDLEDLFRNAEGAAIVPYFAEFKRPETANALGLNPRERDEFLSTFDELARDVVAARTAAEREAAYVSAQKRLYRRLPAATYAKAMNMVHASATRVLLLGR
jgi:hypothetical protein